MPNENDVPCLVGNVSDSDSARVSFSGILSYGSSSSSSEKRSLLLFEGDLKIVSADEPVEKKTRLYQKCCPTV
ncbi:hypothetical protein DPMN_098330 [Dreissena polymorpha]|uniref:Uncharacterized protein n=1 Tax=Dreissena polymorpha TaxID=45954 RepID=A0A9D4LF04_DREPO|nr:hypothetical protein DPMN_098330 [Dreissena polymorpha]